MGTFRIFTNALKEKIQLMDKMNNNSNNNNNRLHFVLEIYPIAADQPLNKEREEIGILCIR